MKRRLWNWNILAGSEMVGKKLSSSTEALYLLSDSATGDSEMPANQGHCLPLWSNTLLQTDTEVKAKQMEWHQSGKKNVEKGRSISTQIFRHCERKTMRILPSLTSFVIEFFPNYFSIESDNLSSKAELKVSNLWMAGKLHSPFLNRESQEKIKHFLGSNPGKNYARTYLVE